MPFGIVLQDETGRALERVGDRTGEVSRLILDSEGAFLLRTIDPYGDTIFNRTQAPHLLREWELVERRADSPAARTLCSQIRQIIERVERGPHLYVRFVGD
jgi:hypothetical protein